MHELRVLTGLHRGAALPLCGEQWSIGAAQDADLALYDPGIKDRHCQLLRTLQGWEVTALEGSLNDNEGQRCDVLHDLQPGTAFAIGHIWLSIVSAATPWSEDPDGKTEKASESAPVQAMVQPSLLLPTAIKPPLPLWTKMMYLMLTFLLLAMLGGWLLNSSMASPSAPPTPGKQQLTDVSHTYQVISSMLLDRVLDKQVSLTSDGDSLILTGNLTEEDNQRLQRMMVTLYHRYDVRPTIHNRVSAINTHLPFNIVQITSGPRANIVTDTGKRIFIGDEVDRLRLVSISHDNIEFAGRESIRVRW